MYHMGRPWIYIKIKIMKGVVLLVNLNIATYQDFPIAKSHFTIYSHLLQQYLVSLNMAKKFKYIIYVHDLRTNNSIDFILSFTFFLYTIFPNNLTIIYNSCSNFSSRLTILPNFRLLYWWLNAINKWFEKTTYWHVAYVITTLNLLEHL